MWDYSINKWASEKKLVELATGTDVKYTIIRPCVTYGDTRILMALFHNMVIIDFNSESLEWKAYC